VHHDFECGMQSALLRDASLSESLLPEPAAPAFPQLAQEPVLHVAVAPSRLGTPATPASLRCTSSSVASQSTASVRGTVEDVAGPAAAAGAGAVFGMGGIGTAGAALAPPGTPEEEVYPDWWNDGPPEHDACEFQPVRPQHSGRLCRQDDHACAWQDDCACVRLRERAMPCMRAFA
jgi:hypothetical protein